MKILETNRFMYSPVPTRLKFIHYFCSSSRLTKPSPHGLTSDRELIDIIECERLYCQPDTTKDRDKIPSLRFYLCLCLQLIWQRSHLPYHNVRHLCHVRTLQPRLHLWQTLPWNMRYA